MTSAASAIPALIDRLVIIGNAAFGTTSPVDVRDGPAVSMEDTGQQLWIGANDDPAQDEAASSDQSWPYASSQFRREELTIHCMALAWSGDDDFKTVRDQAFAQMQVFTAAVVADASFSSSVLMARSAGSNVSLLQGFNAQGACLARVSFDITSMQQFQG